MVRHVFVQRVAAIPLAMPSRAHVHMLSSHTEKGCAPYDPTVLWNERVGYGMQPLRTILLVDDNEVFAEMMAEFLPLFWGDRSPFPITVSTAATLDAAVAAIAICPPDLIVLDLCLPGFKELEAVTIIVQVMGTLPKPIPVVVLSGYLTDTMDVAALEKGAQECVRKSGADLVSRVARAVEHSWARNQYIEQRMAILRGEGNGRTMDQA